MYKGRSNVLGKEEVDSSILSGSTSNINKISNFSRWSASRFCAVARLFGCELAFRSVNHKDLRLPHGQNFLLSTTKGRHCLASIIAYSALRYPNAQANVHHGEPSEDGDSPPWG